MICLFLVILTFLITPGNLESITRVVSPTQLSQKSVKFLLQHFPSAFIFNYTFIKLMKKQHALYIDAKMNRQEFIQLLLAKASVREQLMLEFLA